MNVQAQNLSTLISKHMERMNAGSPLQCNTTFIVKDDANGYARARHACKTQDSQSNYLADYGLWKGKQGAFMGIVYVYYESSEIPITPIFIKIGDEDNNVELYDNQAVNALYQEKLAQIQAKGAEGSEILYAELPQKGTTIKLHIALNTELKANKGIPKWKMLIGELQFDKTTSKFVLVKK